MRVNSVAAMFAYYPEIDTTSIVLANQDCNVWELHRKVEGVILGEAGLLIPSIML